jgi:GTP-binding protein
MQFIDEAKIFIKSGSGGAGCMSFRREAHIPRGGPDGGNGGRGGSIIFEANKSINTLVDFRFQKHYEAKNGESGKGALRNGKSADDLVIKVPLGTQIFNENGDELLYDFINEEQNQFLKGGGGGLGNHTFKTSTNRAPRKATKGWPGNEMWITLKLKLFCDVGLVGFPNAGKSSFLACTSRAKPKIADYPFTTLKPQLGIIYIDKNEFVMADIPGLIEGASTGKGLGFQFLRHIERSKAILHLIDITREDYIEAYFLIRKELENYSKLLATKPEIIALNKIDLLQEDEIKQRLKNFKKKVKGKQVFTISAGTSQVGKDLLRELYKLGQG